MLFEILKHIRNYFPDLTKQMTGHFEINDGSVDPFPVLATNQYFLIEGSAMNDGVWKNGDLANLVDESFDGVITPLKIPADFLTLVKEIEEYQSNLTISPYTSESFGGYSYTRATNSRGNVASWQDAFSTRLNSWRKL